MSATQILSVVIFSNFFFFQLAVVSFHMKQSPGTGTLLFGQDRQHYTNVILFDQLHLSNKLLLGVIKVEVKYEISLGKGRM